jgi:hypothetical protein
MFPEQNQTVFDWIRTGRDELASGRTPDWRGNFVSHLIPPVFESYAKLLHGIQAHYEFVDQPLSAAENAILRIPTCEPLRSFVEGRRADPRGSRIRWKELADLLDVPFAPAINHEWYRQKLKDPWCWPRLLSGPDEGYLSEEECQALASRLKSVVDGEDCFFRFSDIPFYAPVRAGEPQMFRGTLDEGCDFKKEKRLSFEYWWPSSRSWCVCSDYDLKFTIIGGGRNLISTILLDRLLECIEVTPQTRVDSFAPLP